MTVRFLHAADIHLGNRQYGRQEREDDFARSFREMISTAVQQRVDFVLLAGDLFHKRTVEAHSFVQAAHLLDQLKQAGIAALAIEGNHERPYYSEGLSWLDGLATLGLLRVLTGEYHGGELTLDPYSDRYNRGAYIDIKGVRVYGQRYSGATTSRIISDLAGALASQQRQESSDRPAFSILMLHAGLEDVLDHYSGTVQRHELDGLRPYIDYVALGHIHKPYEQDSWLYNPGSLENNSADEAQWEERGYYLVEVEPGPPPAHRADLRRSLRRPYLRHRFTVDAYETPVALEQALHTELIPLKSDEQPILDLVLTGILGFGREHLDLASIQRIAEELVRPLLSQVQDRTRAGLFEIRTDASMTRREMEHQILVEILESDARHRTHAESWAEAALHIKDLALGRQPPEAIIAELERLLGATEGVDEEPERC